MARRRKSTLAVSAEQARQALGVLIHEGKLAAGEVQKALQRRDRLIRALRSSLASLGEEAGKVGRRVMKNGPFPMLRKTGRRAKGNLARKAKHKISAATRKIYQQQGRYMAALRPLSKGARAKVKAIRAKSGVRAAIAAARRTRK